jgi:hypothetical protein
MPSLIPLMRMNVREWDEWTLGSAVEVLEPLERNPVVRDELEVALAPAERE